MPDALDVELFDSSNTSMYITSMTLSPLVLFTEGQFTYTGDAAKRMVVTFAPEAAGQHFVVDNLVFGVPEPAGATSAALAVSLCGVFVRRRRRFVRGKC